MKIDDTEKSFEITVPITKYYILILFFGIAFFVFVYEIIKSIISLSNNYNFSIGLLINLSFLFIIFNYLVWLLNGKEKIIIERSYLKLIKTNGIFTFSKKFDKNKITKITISRELLNPKNFIEYYREIIKEHRKVFPFWINVGRIKFTYKMSAITFFNGLNDEELSSICEVINSEIENSNK